MSSTKHFEILAVEIAPTGLLIEWKDGKTHTFHPVWLREFSNHPDNRDAGTGLRKTEAAFLPLDLSITKAALQQKQNLVLSFSDGHECEFSSENLRLSMDQPRPLDPDKQRTYWGATLESPIIFDVQEVMNSELKLLSLMEHVVEYGFALVRGIPVDVDEVERFSNRIGPARETNWGRTTDVMNIPNPYDLTMTAQALSPHADNPYRHPGPGYIIMHCLKNSAVGGESNMVDGFHAAQSLHKSDPSAFNALCRIKPNFRHAEASAILEDSGALIELDLENNLKRIRFSNRTEQVPPLSSNELDQYYAARQRFAEIIFSDAMNYQLKLNPGEGLIWDNYRILHGRTAFDTSTGERHMRHCYMDRDVFSSRYKVLKQNV